MSDESQTFPATPRQPRRAASDRVRDVIQAMAQGEARVASHRETAWASATFAGTRHQLELLFEGIEGVAAGEQLIAHLPDHEFTIPRQLVADAAVVEVDHQMLPAPRLAVSVELLLLEDA